jgi:hypothetical protein
MLDGHNQWTTATSTRGDPSCLPRWFLLSAVVVVGFPLLRSRCCRPDYARDPKLSVIVGGPSALPLGELRP